MNALYLVVLNGVEGDHLALTTLELQRSRVHFADGIDNVLLSLSPLSPLLVEVLLIIIMSKYVPNSEHRTCWYDDLGLLAFSR